jgi:hypothetical protein
MQVAYGPSNLPSYSPTIAPTAEPTGIYVGNYFTCTGLCSPGYYCPLNSTSPMQTPCPAGTYGEYLYIYIYGYRYKYIYTHMYIYVYIYINAYTHPGSTAGLGSASCSGVCPLSHYCPLGTAVPVPCPPGVFGNVTGLRSMDCNNDCKGKDICTDVNIHFDKFMNISTYIYMCMHRFMYIQM